MDFLHEPTLNRYVVVEAPLTEHLDFFVASFAALNCLSKLLLSELSESVAVKQSDWL